MKNRNHSNNLIFKPNCAWSMLIARVLIVAMFAMSLIGKIADFSTSVAYAESAITFIPGELSIIAAIILEIIGVVTILLGWKMEIGAIALIIFTALSNIFFHNQLGDQMQLIFFLKNLAVIGGLILIAGSNPGRFSIDG